LHIQLKEEAEMLGASALTHDFQEGIRAFIEKRAPEYWGE
jgi:enoyl-CoA hydratase/carnithine racemase